MAVIQTSGIDLPSLQRQHARMEEQDESLLKRQFSDREIGAILSREAGRGHVSRSTLSWATDTAIAMGNGYQPRVKVRSTRRGTDISVRTDLGNLAGGLHGGFMGGVGYILARSIFTGIARRRRRRNRLIADELVAAAEDLQAPPPDSTAPAPR